MGRAQRGYTSTTMAELGLKKKEIDAIEFAFDVYDFKGDGKVDAFYAGDLIRACNLNPTLKTIAEIGGTTEKGKKTLTKADVFPMYKAAKDSKDQDRWHHREGQEDPDQGRRVPHVQGRQGLQGPGWLPRLCWDPEGVRQEQRRHHAG